MKLSQNLEEALFIHSDNELLQFLSEDVVISMLEGDFSPLNVQRGFEEIFTSYSLNEGASPIINEAVDEFCESMQLDEGLTDLLKKAAKDALKSVGKAALDVAKEGGKQAVALGATELKKKSARSSINQKHLIFFRL